MFEPITGLGCTFTVLLLADLANMSLDYLYSLKKLFREDTEEEPAGDDETIEEEAIDDNNNEAPAIVFEQQELPRNLGK